ncbi:ATP-binding protein [Marinospirillum sp.]|uniref:sensor histidine kinase n=1 Tax=Marinospirillum sp. TaxID=2183934 RepID=UPI002870441B|nr:ATP-binding protein [Marinospirillum sp.]MDR9468261.1 ATP-binding protein [Marinospirillum sp.]
MFGTTPQASSQRQLLVAIWVAALLISLPLFLFNFIQREHQEQQRLQDLADHKKQEFLGWMDSIDVDLLRLAHLPSINASLTASVLAEQVHSDLDLNHHFLNETLESYLSPFGDFLEIFMLNSSGDVVYSSDPEQIGKNKASRRYFIQGIHAPYIQNVYHSVTLQSAAMTLARPLLLPSPDGGHQHKVGVIAARADLEKLRQLMVSADEEASPRSYLVNRYNFFITPPESSPDSELVYPRATHSKGVNSCLRNRPLPQVYLDHKGQKVRGVGHWLPRHQLCLVVEENYTSGIYLLLQQLLGLMALLLPFSLAAWWLAPRLSFFKSQDAADKNRVDTRFLSLIGHEIRTPLNGIIGMLSLLQESQLNAEQRQQAQVADASAQQLLNLLNHLIARARQGGEPASVEEVQWIQLNQPLELLLRSFTWAAEKKGLSLSFQGDPQLESLEVQTQLTLLLQLVSNLLENAVKFTEKGGIELEVSCELQAAKQARITLTVSDTGPGIAPQDQDKIFQPFQRLQPDPRHPVTSLGLGLAISKELAEQLQGQLELHSKPGQGSQFMLTFIAPVRKTSRNTQ